MTATATRANDPGTTGPGDTAQAGVRAEVGRLADDRAGDTPAATEKRVATRVAADPAAQRAAAVRTARDPEETVPLTIGRQKIGRPASGRLEVVQAAHVLTASVLRAIDCADTHSATRVPIVLVLVATSPIATSGRRSMIDRRAMTARHARTARGTMTDRSRAVRGAAPEPPVQSDWSGLTRTGRGGHHLTRVVRTRRGRRSEHALGASPKSTETRLSATTRS